jgi:hypothetical protein
MSEYTHNDDMADLLWAKDQEIKLMKEALLRIATEIGRVADGYDELENEHPRGL